MHTHFAATLAVGAAVICSAAYAADNTRYISIAGNNANPCTLAKPCRSLQYAINVTPAGGEVRILDSGFFGNNATIKKSLTISGNGHTVYLGTTITVDKAGAVVALRDMVLNGQGAVQDGIKVDAAGAVHIECCLVLGFALDGIRIAAAGVEVFVLDSISRDNSLGLGVDSGAPRLTIDNSRFDRNLGTGVEVGSGFATINRSTVSSNVNNGIVASDGATVSIMSTVAARNGENGFVVVTGGIMNVESSASHGNDVGLLVFTGAVARVSSSTFTGNEFGIFNTGTVETRQNNTNGIRD